MHSPLNVKFLPPVLSLMDYSYITSSW